ncbi:MAG: hypothetical protein COB41_01650 [Proteobacteria bacterium]|nr:MAG: hypothetical protein COB41_01650 [Pseudomonadota bacterium]
MIVRKNTIKLFVRQQSSKLGAVICAARQAQGLTQAKFAEALHVTIPTIRKLESGDASVSLHTCLAALLILNIEKGILHTEQSERQTLPQIEAKQRASFAKRLQLQGEHARDAENSAWILSLSPQQRVQALINQEKEQSLCGIARP